MLKFIDSTHTYVNEENVKYTSVTTLVSKFKKPFDAEYWSTYKAVERVLNSIKEGNFDNFKKAIGGYQNVVSWSKKIKPKAVYEEILKVKAEILAEWELEKQGSCIKGSAYHKEQEDNLIAKKVVSVNGYQLPVYSNDAIVTNDNLIIFAKDLSKLEPGVYVEILVYSHKYQVSGLIDKLILYPDKSFDIEDYKGLALDTPIATNTGWKTINDIKIGDIIFDGNGKETKVKHVSKVHYNPCFNIKFDSNESLTADHEHKWRVEILLPVIDKKYKEVELTTEEIYNLKQKGYRVKIKCVSIKTEEKELPIDPYVLGLWLGDGSSACSILTSMNPEVWKEIKKRGYEIGEDVSQGSSGKATMKTIKNIRSLFNDLNLINNKHLPDIYARASYEQRLDLLKGFMDADGSYNKIRSRCVMNTTKTWQKDALIELLSSLGFKPTLFVGKGSGFGKRNIKVYQIWFTPDVNVFLTRNQDKKFIKTKFSEYRYITSIVKVDTVATKCLAVESEDKTFLAGKTFIKTHNTNKEIKLSAFKNEKMLAPCNKLDDCNYNHYTLQLSLYAYLLELKGYSCNKLSILHKPNEETKEREYVLNYEKETVKQILKTII